TSPERRLNTLRELYAKGDVRGAMALAQELRERIAKDLPKLGHQTSAVDSPDASIHVEYGGDVSIEVPVDGALSGLAVPTPPIPIHLPAAHGADAPDASVTLEYGSVDVSLTGLEGSPFGHDAIDVSLSSLVTDLPADLSMQGLAGIIGTIESS